MSSLYLPVIAVAGAVGVYTFPNLLKSATSFTLGSLIDGTWEAVSSRVNVTTVSHFLEDKADDIVRRGEDLWRQLEMGDRVGTLLGKDINRLMHGVVDNVKVSQAADKLGKEFAGGISGTVRPATDAIGKELDHLTNQLVTALYTNPLRAIRNEFLMQHLIPICASLGLMVGTPFIVSYLYYKAKHNIGKPKLAVKTRKLTLLTPLSNFCSSAVKKVADIVLWRSAKPKTAPVFNAEITTKLNDVISSTINLRKNGGFLQNILLYGPGGTGKTLISEKISTESNMNYIMMSGGDLAQYIHRGEHVSELNKLMSTINRSSRPTILFIDEAESLCRNRDHLDAPHTELLNIFLKETGTSTNKFMLILATNRLEDIDPAVLSRMDYKIYIGPPAVEERAKIIETSAPQYFTTKECKEFFYGDKAVEIARMTDGLTGRALFKMLNAIFIRKASTKENILTPAIIKQVTNDFVTQEREIAERLGMVKKEEITFRKEKSSPRKEEISPKGKPVSSAVEKVFPPTMASLDKYKFSELRVPVEIKKWIIHALKNIISR